MPPSIWRSFKCLCMFVCAYESPCASYLYVCACLTFLWNVAVVSRGSLPSHAVALNEQAIPLHSALAFVHLPVYK